jgi:signal transduction histidine kinase
MGGESMSWMALFFAAAFLCALIYALYEKRYVRRTLNNLDSMIIKALDGEFSEDDYDESLKSSIEAKFARYLAASSKSFNGVKEEKERIKTLISDISHQTRTPVANIRLYTQLLGEQNLGEESRDCLEALESQTEKLQMLIEALVKTSRLETGILELHTKPEPLRNIVERSVEQYRPKADEKNIKLDAFTSDISAVCDAKWTEEAVCNLLDNAVKYTPDGGNITVRMSEYEMFCRIDVTDDGNGISEEEQPKIFGRFYRGKDVYNKQGVGIGLYLTRQIVSNEGGYMKVISSEGNGSTFSIFLQKA